MKIMVELSLAKEVLRKENFLIDPSRLEETDEAVIYGNLEIREGFPSSCYSEEKCHILTNGISQKIPWHIIVRNPWFSEN